MADNPSGFTIYLTTVIAASRPVLGIAHLKRGEYRPHEPNREFPNQDHIRVYSHGSTFAGMERQLVTEARGAAQLSRNLELPRHETEGRHARAIRLAVKHGSVRQQLEARHDALWTAFWWYDDAAAVSDGYGAIKAEALGADHARNIKSLVQLHQLLVNGVLYHSCPRRRRTCRHGRTVSRPLSWP